MLRCSCAVESTRCGQSLSHRARTSLTGLVYSVDQGSPALRASADAIQQLYGRSSSSRWTLLTLNPDIEMADRQRKRQLQPPPMGSSWSKRKREEEEQDVNKFQRLVKKAFVSGFPTVVIAALTRL